MTLRRTPFYGKHLAAGARMVPFAGFEMPVQYQGVQPEHLACRSGAGLFDVSHMGEIRVRGPKAREALAWLLSNAVLKIVDGNAQYNVLCNPDGGVVDDVFVYRRAEDDLLVCVNAANREKDFAWMVENNPFKDGASFEDEGDAWAQLAIQGPDAVALVQSLCAEDVAALPRHAFLVGTFAGVGGAWVARTGYTGEDGFEVFLPAHLAEPAWDILVDAGAVPVGLGARDTLRLEAGNCLYGHELDDLISPLEAGLGWVVKLNKPGGFLGSAAIARRAAAPGHRKLIGLALEGKRIPREGMTVLQGDQAVGKVTSGTFGPSVQRGIALALVDPALVEAGATLAVDLRGRVVPAEVVKPPFYRRAQENS